MKKNIIYVLAVLAAAVSCVKTTDEDISSPEEKDPEVEMITETITANGSESTKADISDALAFTWSTGDQLAVHANDGKYYTSSALVSGGSKQATFSVTHGGTLDAFAVFPASIVAENATNYGQSEHTLDVTLPGSYTIEEVSGTRTPCPMIATNTGADWAFKQLCGLLRLTVNNIPPSAKRLELDFDGKKICGSFSIAAPVTPGTSTITGGNDGSNDIITITKNGTDVTLNGDAWLDELVLNIPLPVGTYSNIIVRAYDALTGGNQLFSQTKSFSYTAARLHGKKLTVYYPVFKVNNEGKRVLFAPGNLQYNNNESTYKWRFAANQYDYIGAWDTSTWVDYLGWGTWVGDSPNPLKTTDTDESYTMDSADFTQESLLADASQRGYDWFTLTLSEWQYIFFYRKASTVCGTTYARYAKAKVNDIYGLILFPDVYIHPAGVSDIVGIKKTDNTGWNGNNLTLDEWSEMESAGAVFLPASGYRYMPTLLDDINNRGHYWAEDNGGPKYGNHVLIDETSFTTYGIFRHYGASVRLVREVH